MPCGPSCAGGAGPVWAAAACRACCTSPAAAPTRPSHLANHAYKPRLYSRACLQAAEQLGLPRIVSIQNSYSLLVRGPWETDLAETCARRQCNVGLLAYSPLAGGTLSGKYIQPGPGVEKARLNLFQGGWAGRAG